MNKSLYFIFVFVVASLGAIASEYFYKDPVEIWDLLANLIIRIIGFLCFVLIGYLYGYQNATQQKN